MKSHILAKGLLVLGTIACVMPAEGSLCVDNLPLDCESAREAGWIDGGVDEVSCTVKAAIDACSQAYDLDKEYLIGLQECTSYRVNGFDEEAAQECLDILDASVDRECGEIYARYQSAVSKCPGAVA